jgi:hypothetical protein
MFVEVAGPKTFLYVLTVQISQCFRVAMEIATQCIATEFWAKLLFLNLMVNAALQMVLSAQIAKNHRS